MAPADEPVPSPDVIITGAGVAGSITARRLAETGARVVVLDPAPPFPPNPERRGALYMKPAVNYSPETRFAHEAFLAASAFYSRLQTEHADIDFWSPTGTLSLAWNEREHKRQEKLIARNQWDPAFLQPVSPQKASSLSGLEVTVPGLWFPAGGHLRVDALRQAALTHPLIRVITTTAHAQQAQAGTDRWYVQMPSGDRFQAQTLIFATGAASTQWAPELPLGCIRGQLTTLPATKLTPRVAMAGAGYALPPFGGRVCVGATFDRHSDLEKPDSHSDQANLENLAHWLPSLAEALAKPQAYGNWAGFRSTTPDHMPLAGELNGHYVLAGLGGKGLMYAPLLADHLMALRLGASSPLDEDAAERIAPSRFFQR
ncbi:FAD-dependent 5-carboxymethylaminomethyl-2-thiouridine(34) oxidoreductase MnmC [Salicola sp. Rm-C-2C1-2]|uniref:FAD-dependent 5-carboxymethylaminomethyl-2-thiouridine(34) oxidoreductase MnmC n=1 Tax=Salicola sp. Rm-C-2C1-2 TaxID=3141321 RepID=UPI0032E4A741